jgi:SAM-dependent methyltransferase
MKTVEEAYQTYISEVSAPSMAISLETAKWLFDYCLKYEPQSILDLGSGFSTYVFARYKLINPKVQIFSIDTDLAYLDKTIQFVDSEVGNGLKIYTNTIGYDSSAKDFELMIQSKKKYDFICFDIAETEFRLKVLEVAAKYGKNILLDDWNSPKLRDESVKIINNIKSITPLTELTDSFSRFPCLIELSDKSILASQKNPLVTV